MTWLDQQPSDVAVPVPAPPLASSSSVSSSSGTLAQAQAQAYATAPLGVGAATAMDMGHVALRCFMMWAHDIDALQVPLDGMTNIAMCAAPRYWTNNMTCVVDYSCALVPRAADGSPVQVLGSMTNVVMHAGPCAADDSIDAPAP